MICPKSATSPSAAGSFPRRCFVVISQAEAAETLARTGCRILFANSDGSGFRECPNKPSRSLRARNPRLLCPTYGRDEACPFQNTERSLGISLSVIYFAGVGGGPGQSPTADLRVRSALLYATELPGHASSVTGKLNVENICHRYSVVVRFRYGLVQSLSGRMRPSSCSR